MAEISTGLVNLKCKAMRQKSIGNQEAIRNIQRMYVCIYIYYMYIFRRSYVCIYIYIIYMCMYVKYTHKFSLYIHVHLHKCVYIYMWYQIYSVHGHSIIFQMCIHTYALYICIQELGVGRCAAGGVGWRSAGGERQAASGIILFCRGAFHSVFSVLQ